MIAVRNGVRDRQRDRHSDRAAALLISSHHDNGKEGRFAAARHAAAAAGERDPRRAGHAVEVRRLTWLRLDAVIAAEGLHIRRDRAVERAEIVGEIRPAVGKRAVVRVKDRIVGNDPVPDAQLAVRVPEHAEILDAAERPGDAVDRRRVKAVSVRAAEAEQIFHVYGCGHVEFDLERLTVIAVVLTARPGFHVDFCVMLHFRLYLLLYCGRSDGYYTSIIPQTRGNASVFCGGSPEGQKMPFPGRRLRDTEND